DYIDSFAQDWHTDIKSLEHVIKQNEMLLNSANQLFEDLMANKLTDHDVPQRVFALLNYQFFTPQDFTFQSIKETGDFRLLRDVEFKRNLLKLKRYHGFIAEGQKNFQHALDNYIVPLFADNINLARQQVTTKGFVNDHRFLNLVHYTINDLNGRIEWYKRTLNFLNKLTNKQNN
ncbi:MAG: hypothetical protein OQJ89_01990, partial [Kangiellaceae bacterium]|nr:hypothetical protein [Kangiellaceae bacterium]